MTVRALSVWDRTGTSAGVFAALSLGISYAITRTTAAPLAGSDVEYARVLLAERIKWEWVTFVRLLGGILVLWFTGSLADRLRLAEAETGRVAEAAFGLGVLWSAVWLFSAFFNSASIVLAADYNDATGSRLTGVLARETPYVLTGSVVFTLLLATSFVTLRHGGIPKPYAYATAFLTLLVLLLAVVDWYGEGTLGSVMVTLALTWTATTSIVLMTTSRLQRRVADANFKPADGSAR